LLFALSGELADAGVLAKPIPAEIAVRFFPTVSKQEK
jgi:hypothetical protein